MTREIRGAVAGAKRFSPHLIFPWPSGRDIKVCLVVHVSPLVEEGVMRAINLTEVKGAETDIMAVLEPNLVHQKLGRGRVRMGEIKTSPSIKVIPRR